MNLLDRVIYLLFLCIVFSCANPPSEKVEQQVKTNQKKLITNNSSSDDVLPVSNFKQLSIEIDSITNLIKTSTVKLNSIDNSIKVEMSSGTDPNNDKLKILKSKKSKSQLERKKLILERQTLIDERRKISK